MKNMEINKKIGKGKRASENQKEFLINFLESNCDIANDKFATPQAIKYRDEVWEELANNLNAIDGTKKDSVRWRKFWSDFKLYICNKQNELNKKKQRNMFKRVKKLSCLEKRVLKIALKKPNTVEQIPVFTTIHANPFDETFENDEITFEDIKPSIEEFLVNSECIVNETPSTSSVITRENISKNAATISASTQQRKFKRKAPAKVAQLEKLLKIEEKKLSAMKEANSLKRQQITILQEQTDTIKANVQAKEIIAINLQHLIDILGKQN